jgi:transcriptional regulator with XRE-family HTH domain
MDMRSGVPQDAGMEIVRAAVKARRVALRLSQQDASAAGDLSLATWSNLERGRLGSLAHDTVIGVCRALGWSPDSIDRLLRGEDPVVLTTAEGAFRSESRATVQGAGATAQVAFSAEPGVIDRLREVPDRLDRLERMVEELLDAARPNPTEPPPGTVPARTDAQRAAKRKP